MWEKLKQELKERWATAELAGGIFRLAWGWGFFYYGFPWQITFATLAIVQRPQFGYNYALMSVGIALMLAGLKRLIQNPVAAKAKLNSLVEERNQS